MDEFLYDDSKEKELTSAVDIESKKLISDLNTLLALYKKRDDAMQKNAKEIINAAKTLAQSITDEANKDKTAIQQERFAWESEKAKIAQTYRLEPDVTIDVGGNVFRTTMTTLQRFPDTMIGAMFSGRHPLNTNKDGAIFVDRDGTHFRHILNFLRDPYNYNVKHLGPAEVIELKREATYYGLGDLMFPFQKAENEVVRLSNGSSVTISQTDDAMWHLSDQFGTVTKLTYCSKCDRGYINNYYFVDNFAKTRKVLRDQPKPKNLCEICRR